MSTDPATVAVVVPIIHGNGTSAKDLLAQRYDAADALTDAGDVLARAAPNARDHYPQGPEYIRAANEQHDRRIKLLKGLIAEYSEEIAAIQDRIDI